MNLWDSTLTEAQAYDRPEFDPPKSKSHFTAKLDKTPENQWVSAKPFPLWDACEYLSVAPGGLLVETREWGGRRVPGGCSFAIAAFSLPRSSLFHFRWKRKSAVHFRYLPASRVERVRH